MVYRSISSDIVVSTLLAFFFTNPDHYVVFFDANYQALSIIPRVINSATSVARQSS